MADKTNSFAVIARDITSEKQLESRMSETEKLAGIGQLAAGIAHQLNTPLGAILLSAQMLEETVQDEDDSEDIRPVRKPRPRRYKIQEVIKVRQILLVQVCAPLQ